MIRCRKSLPPRTEPALPLAMNLAGDESPRGGCAWRDHNRVPNQQCELLRSGLTTPTMRRKFRNRPPSRRKPHTVTARLWRGEKTALWRGERLGGVVGPAD